MYAQAGMFFVLLVFPNWSTYARVPLQLVSFPLENTQEIFTRSLLRLPSASLLVLYLLSPLLVLSSAHLKNRVYLVMAHGILSKLYVAGKSIVDGEWNT